MSTAAGAVPKEANPYTASLAILCLAGFLTTVDQVAFPMVMVPVQHAFALSDAQLGLLTGLASSAMYALASLPVARWADVGDRRAVIAISLGVWSLMTALCGFAHSVWQLFLARFGVGFGQAGSSAPAQSLICDYYPPARRSLPLSVFALGAAVGGIIGYAVVGLAADRLGWRHALMLLSVPGLVAAAIIRLRVIEPRAHAARPRGTTDTRPPFRKAVADLCRKRSFVQMCVGFAVWGLASGGMGQWLPVFFIRAHHVTLTQVGLMLGLVVGSSLCIGLILGGWIGNRLLARDLRWGLRLPVLAMCLYTAVTIGALLVPSLTWSLVLFFVGGCVGGLVIAPLLATVGGLVSAHVRALSLAVMGLLSALIGTGFGPVAIGVLSDELRRPFGTESLRDSLALMTALILWGVLHLHFASRHLLDEFEDRPATQIE